MCPDLPTIHHHNIRPGLKNLHDIVRNIKSRNLPRPEPSRQTLQDPTLQLRIEAGKRLIQQQHPRLRSQRTSQRHPLLLTPGKLPRHPFRQMTSLKKRQHLPHARPAIP